MGRGKTMAEPKKTMNDFIRQSLGITPASQEPNQPPPPPAQGNAGNGTGAPPPDARPMSVQISELIRRALGYY